MTGHVVNRGEVGFARIFWGRANADEDGVTSADGFAGVGGIGDFSFLVGGGENLIEMMLVYRNAAGIELGDALAVNIRADDIVAGLGKASSGDQTNVPTTDD